MKFKKPNLSAQYGFTLLEVLVALVIVGTALGASLRAIGGLTKNNGDLRTVMLATWSADNHLVQLRLAANFPPVGDRTIECPQGNVKLICEEHVVATQNPFLRSVEVRVYAADEPQRRLIKMTQMVANGL
jgi:general secretion pathway protein I